MLSRETCFRIFLAGGLGAWAFLTTGCVQPLGPGFRFINRQTEIRGVADSASSSGLHIRVVDRFDNAGDRPLRSMEVPLPEGPPFRPRTLRVPIPPPTLSP